MATSNNTHVALLRGINVGGKNKLPMRELAAMFEQAGCGDVRTYIASGNVVFTAAPALAKTLSAAISKRIVQRFNLSVPVVLRSSAELERVAADNPFVASGAKPEFLHVGFLSDQPSASLVSALDPNRSPGDAYVVHKSVIYLHLPDGVARSRLTNAYFDSTLKLTSTIRNWRTVLKLAAMAKETG